MRCLVIRMFITLLLSGLFATTILAQTSAKEAAANLRLQLSEVQIRKAEVQALDEQLVEDLRPENIERSFAVAYWQSAGLDIGVPQRRITCRN